MIRAYFVYIVLILIGLADYATGREVHIGSMYLLIVVVATWKLSLRGSLIFALVVVGIWSGVERISVLHYTRQWYFFWNIINHLFAVSIAVLMVAKAKKTLENQRRLIRELGRTLLTANRIGELVPVCRICHEVHLDEGYRSRVDEILLEDVDGNLGGQVCADCLTAQANRVTHIPVEAYFRPSAST